MPWYGYAIIVWIALSVLVSLVLGRMLRRRSRNAGYRDHDSVV